MKPFGISSNERIKRKKDFQKIYSSGKIIISEDKKLKALYIYQKELEKPVVKIAAAVHKKAGSAVWRNRLKRLIKEAYRLNKKILTDVSNEKEILLEIIFSPNSINQKKNSLLRYNEILPGMIDLMYKIKKNM